MTTDDRSPELKRRGTAYHEAGHAVAALAFGWEFTGATLVPPTVEGVTRHGGVLNIAARAAGPDGRRSADQERQIAAISMAGPEAELLETGADEGRGGDELLIRWNLDTGRSAAESDAYVQRATAEARALVMARWAEVRAVAEALLEHERLDYEQALHIAAAARGSE